MRTFGSGLGRNWLAVSGVVLALFLIACDGRQIHDRSNAPTTIDVQPIAHASGVPHMQVTDAALTSILRRRQATDSVVFLDRDAIAITTHSGIAVTDINRVLLLDSAGRLLKTSGRVGEGPGEFRNVHGICQSNGDTLVVVDDGSSRVSVMTSTGRFVRSFNLVMGQPAYQHACLADGTILVRQSLGVRNRFGAYRYSLNGTLRDSSLTLDFETFLGGRLVLAGAALFAYGDSVVFGNPWTGVLQLFSPSGQLPHTFRLVGLHPDPIPKDITPWIHAKDGTPLNWEAKAKNLPYFQNLHITSSGDIWYNDYPKSKHESIRWSGFTREGKPLGTLTIDSSLVVNQSVVVQEFETSSVLLRFEQDGGGTTFQIVPFSSFAEGKKR